MKAITHFRGKPLESLSKSEMLDAIHYLGNRVEQLSLTTEVLYPVLGGRMSRSEAIQKLGEAHKEETT